MITKNIFFSIAALFMVILTSGCSTTSLDINYTGENAGALVLSLDAYGTNASIYGLRICSKKEPYPLAFISIEAEMIETTASGKALLGETNQHERYPNHLDYLNKEVGQVFLLHLPEGLYEICNFLFYEYYEIGKARVFSSKQPFSLPIDIKKGKAIYAGSYKLEKFHTKELPNFDRSAISGSTNAFRPDSPKPENTIPVLEVIDQFDRDVHIIKKRYPQENFGKIHNATPSTEETKNPLVVFVRPGQSVIQSLQIINR